MLACLLYVSNRSHFILFHGHFHLHFYVLLTSLRSLLIWTTELVSSYDLDLGVMGCLLLWSFSVVARCLWRRPLFGAERERLDLGLVLIICRSCCCWTHSLFWKLYICWSWAAAGGPWNNSTSTPHSSSSSSSSRITMGALDLGLIKDW
jgi:hypothetical protein